MQQSARNGPIRCSIRCSKRYRIAQGKTWPAMIVKMLAIILFVTDTVMLVRLNGTLISLRSSDLKRRVPCE